MRATEGKSPRRRKSMEITQEVRDRARAQLRELLRDRILYIASPRCYQSSVAYKLEQINDFLRAGKMIGITEAQPVEGDEPLKALASEIEPLKTLEMEVEVIELLVDRLRGRGLEEEYLKDIIKAVAKKKEDSSANPPQGGTGTVRKSE